MKKTLFALTAIAASLFAGSASALTVTYNLANPNGSAPGYATTNGTDYVQPASTTNWNHLLTLPKFNMPGYTLSSAVLTYDGSFKSSGAIDSEDAAPSTVNAKVLVDLNFFGDGTHGAANLGGFTDTANLIKTLYNGALAADNEAGGAGPDFIGTDAKNGLNVSQAMAQGMFNITNLAAVKGTGNFKVYVEALGGTSTTGSANLFYNILTEAKSNIAITYTYDLTPVPAPAALSLMSLGLVGLGFSRRKSA